MKSTFVHSCQIPGDPYRAPLMLSARLLLETLETRMQCIQLLVEEDELSRLIREQAEEMAA